MLNGTLISLLAIATVASCASKPNVESGLYSLGSALVKPTEEAVFFTTYLATGIAFTAREVFSGQGGPTLLEGVLLCQSLVGGFPIFLATLGNKVVRKRLRRLWGLQGQDVPESISMN